MPITFSTIASLMAPIALTAVLLNAVPALAQQGPGGGRMMMERFQTLDINEDGTIAPGEAAAWHESVFYAMDADDDGALTLEEFMAVRMGPGHGFNPERQRLRQQYKEARFGEMDADGDTSVNQAEFLAHGKARFEAADINGDGKVTVWEFRAQRRPF